MKEWVVHIIGQDDLVEFGGELEALHYANGINRTMAKIKRQPNDPVVFAVVYGAEEKLKGGTT